MGLLDKIEIFRLRKENVMLAERVRELEAEIKELGKPAPWSEVDHSKLEPWQINKAFRAMPKSSRPLTDAAKVLRVIPRALGWFEYQIVMTVDYEGDCMTEDWYVRAAESGGPPIIMSGFDFYKTGIHTLDDVARHEIHKQDQAKYAEGRRRA